MSSSADASAAAKAKLKAVRAKLVADEWMMRQSSPSHRGVSSAAAADAAGGGGGGDAACAGGGRGAGAGGAREGCAVRCASRSVASSSCQVWIRAGTK